MRPTTTRGLGLALLIVAVSATSACAAPIVSLHARLTPERLGRGTTLGFSFEIATRAGLVPPPLIDAEVRYPGNLGLALSGLGLATCDASTLEARAAQGCPAESRMGTGRAVAELAVASAVITEPAEVVIVRGPTQNGQLALFFYADGKEPVSAQIIFSGLLLPAPAPFGGAVGISVPLVESWPGASDLSVVALHATLGPEGLTYYRRQHGRVVAYNPRGILLPKVCPRAGFQFEARFRFLDGSVASAKTTVPCPRS